jgi:predicted nucleic acid-binding protein
MTAARVDGKLAKDTIVLVKIIADTNTFMAVALREPERSRLIETTRGHHLAAPIVLPYEVGNALSALVKRGRLLPEEVDQVWEAVAKIPVELIGIDIQDATRLAARLGIYAYDAYFLQCALENRCPLLTLDVSMKRIASQLNIRILE